MWGSLRTSVLKMLFEKLWKGAHTVLKAETRHGTYFGIIICFPVSTRSTAGRPSASCLQCTCSFPLFFTQRGRAKIIQRRDYTVPGQQERSCALTYVNCSWDKNMTWEAKTDFSCPVHVTNEPTMPRWAPVGDQSTSCTSCAWLSSQSNSPIQEKERTLQKQNLVR